MELIIGDKLVNIPDYELKGRFINFGSEGTIYEYKGEALKLYDKECFTKRIDEETAIRLSKIRTKRILLPNKPVYDKDGNFFGHTTDFKIERTKDRIGSLTMDKFIREVNLLNNDIIVLSNNKVLLDDLHQDNLLLSGDELYLCDSGKYSFTDKPRDEIYRSNMIEFNYLFTRLVFEGYLNLTKKEKAVLEDYFKPSYICFTDTLLEEGQVNLNQKVRPYIKRLINK